MLITFGRWHLLIGISILAGLLPLLWRQKRKLSYLLFFSIFWLYLLAIVQAVVFPIAIPVGGSPGVFAPHINLIPFSFGDCSMLFLCIRGAIENIILTVPFGFGINFLVPIKPRNSFWLAILVGLVFEFSQLIISMIFRSGFRAVDINDVIFNGTGVLIGYAFFRLFAWVYLKIAASFDVRRNWFFADLYEVALQAHIADKSNHT